MMDTCFFRCPQYCLASSGSRVSQTDASLRADNYKITNYGVMLDITEMAEGWFTEVKEDDSFTFADALMHNNLVSMNQALQGITDISVSVFVSAGRWTADNKHLYRPGDLFHGLTLGPVVCLHNRYRIRSHDESEAGRVDLCLEPGIPRKHPDVIIMECKVSAGGDKNVADAAKHARKQIEENDYGRTLRDAGFDENHICKHGTGYRGKQVCIMN